jgi:hypothetical protein
VTLEIVDSIAETEKLEGRWILSSKRAKQLAMN